MLARTTLDSFAEHEQAARIASSDPAAERTKCAKTAADSGAFARASFSESHAIFDFASQTGTSVHLRAVAKIHLVKCRRSGESGKTPPRSA